MRSKKAMKSRGGLVFIFSRSFLLRTAPHYLNQNAWNRLYSISQLVVTFLRKPNSRYIELNKALEKAQLVCMFTYQLLKFSCHISIKENKRSSTASIHFHRTPSKRFQFLQLLWKKANCLSNNSGLKIIFGRWPDTMTGQRNF